MISFVLIASGIYIICLTAVVGFTVCYDASNDETLPAIAISLVCSCTFIASLVTYYIGKQKSLAASLMAYYIGSRRVLPYLLANILGARSSTTMAQAENAELYRSGQALRIYQDATNLATLMALGDKKRISRKY
jgi:hypothetical protein